MAEAPGAVSDNLQKLLTSAENHCSSSDTVDGLYRNEPADYFKQLVNNTMMPSVTNSYGNPRCPINGKLEGVFFSATLYKGRLPTKSPYGDTRVVVPLKRLFDDSARLYFADFYYLPSKKITTSLWSLQSLIQELTAFVRSTSTNEPTDERTNVFLRKEGSTYKTLRQYKVWVYVIYTDKVDISELDLTDNEGNVIRSGGIRRRPDQSNVSRRGIEGSIEPEALIQVDVPELEKELSMLQLGKMKTDKPAK